MCARLTVLSETPIADPIAGCAKPSSRSNTIRMRWRCFSGMFFQCSAFLSRRTSPLLHLIIGPPESKGISQSHCSRQDSAPNYRKPPDSIRSGSGIRQLSSVKSPAEFFALSNDRVRQQFEILFRQAQELTAIARKVTVATTESAKVSTKLPDAPLRDSSKRGL